MLTPHERRQLEDFDGTATTSASDCVIRLIDAHAARAPQALAIDTMTYRELVHAANGVGYHLLAWCAGPEQVVAVALADGLDLVVALLGPGRPEPVTCRWTPTIPRRVVSRFWPTPGRC